MRYRVEPSDARVAGHDDEASCREVPRRVLRGDGRALCRGRVRADRGSTDGRPELHADLEVLFVWEHNAGRSRMAAALAHELSNGAVAVRSAGTSPVEKIDPIVVEAMSEIGIDVRMEFPKPLTDEVVRAADVVVTLGCGDSCPVYPGTGYQDWPIADPGGQPPEVVRKIRYDVYHHVTELLETLTHATVQ